MYSEDQLTIPTRPLDKVSGWKSFQKDTQHIKAKNYLFDARKFSHKVYAQLDAFEHKRYVVWLDSDIVVIGKLTKHFLKNLIKDHFCAYLGRNDCYTETGFLIFDTHHEDFLVFKQRYADYYNKRYLFELRFWIDCLAFDKAREGLQAKNLTPKVNGMVDVFSRSPLKDIFIHNKGNRKGKDNGKD